MRIIGLDIGRGVAVACLLEHFPVNIQQHYKQLKRNKQFYKLTTSQAGVDKFLSLEPDGIVLEPTGHWYSHFWVTVAKAHNTDIYWVGHSDLDKQRGSYGFTNKRDEEDALCLAACYFTIVIPLINFWLVASPGLRERRKMVNGKSAIGLQPTALWAIGP